MINPVSVNNNSKQKCKYTNYLTWNDFLEHFWNKFNTHFHSQISVGRYISWSELYKYWACVLSMNKKHIRMLMRTFQTKYDFTMCKLGVKIGRCQ